MRGLSRRLRSFQPRRSQAASLRPVEELNAETLVLPDFERLLAEVEAEYLEMEADHAAGVATD